VIQGWLAVPWRSIFSSVHVWALCVAHFCCMWGLFIFISCLPMYFKEILNFDIASVRNLGFRLHLNDIMITII